MSDTWIPLPFPACPACRQSWVRSYHRDCKARGEIVVEPYRRQAKCQGCWVQWTLVQTRFYCTCGRTFNANDVESALSTSELMRDRLRAQFKAMEEAERSIRAKSEGSFSQWIYDVAESLGYAAGTIVGTIKRWLDAL